MTSPWSGLVSDEREDTVDRPTPRSDQVDILGTAASDPSAAWVYIRDELKELRRSMREIESMASGASGQAGVASAAVSRVQVRFDNAQQMLELTRNELRAQRENTTQNFNAMRDEFKKMSEEVFRLLGEVGSMRSEVTELANQVRLMATATKTLDGRVGQLVSALETEATARKQLEVELSSTKSVAVEAKNTAAKVEDAVDDFQDTGKRMIDDLVRRANSGDDFKHEAAIALLHIKEKRESVELETSKKQQNDQLELAKKHAEEEIQARREKRNLILRVVFITVIALIGGAGAIWAAIKGR